MSSNQIVDANGAIHSGQDGRFTGHIQQEGDADQVLPGAELFDPLLKAAQTGNLDGMLAAWDTPEGWEERTPVWEDNERVTEQIIDVGDLLPGLGKDVFVVEEVCGETTCIDVMVPLDGHGADTYLTRSIPMEQFDPGEDAEPGLDVARHYLTVLTGARNELDASRAALTEPKPPLSQEDWDTLQGMFTDARVGWDSFDETKSDFGDYSEEDVAAEKESRARQRELMDRLTALLGS